MGLDCYMPGGAFYVFPDVSRVAENGETFAEELLKISRAHNNRTKIIKLQILLI